MVDFLTNEVHSELKKHEELVSLISTVEECNRLS